MLFFGHIGITTGVARAYDVWGIRVRHSSLDYRIVMLGSLLPDIIDKPVWLLVSIVADETSLSGRDYAHTLLFNLALLIGSLLLLKWGKSWLLILSLSSFLHLVSDQMWNSLVVLLWPLLGPLPKEKTTGWATSLLQGLFLHPDVYIPEIIGLVILLWLVYRVVRRKGIVTFLKDGATR